MKRVLPWVRAALALLLTAGSLRSAESFPDPKADFRGAALHSMPLGGVGAQILAPKKAAVGRPWVLTSRLYEGEDPAYRNVTRIHLALVHRGFHVVALPIGQWQAAYEAMTSRYGLSEGVSLMALGAEGVAVGRWAVEHPGKVVALALDKTVCNVLSWKNHTVEQNAGAGDAWKNRVPLYGFKSEAEVLGLNDDLDRRAAELAAQKVGVVSLVGEEDRLAPYAENGAVWEREYRKAKGEFRSILGKGEGHHPHGLEDPTPVVEFFQKLSLKLAYETFPDGKKARQPVGTLELSPDGERPWLELPESDLAKIRAALPEKAQVTPRKPRKLLVFYRTDFFAHDSIPYWNRLLELLGEKTGAFSVTLTQSYAELMPERLAQYDAVFFNNTCRMRTPEVVKASLQAFVKSGKGFVGNHGAGDNWHDWPEGLEMLGGEFVGHPFYQAQMKLDDPASPLLACFGGKSFPMADELYAFKPTFSRSKVRVLLSIDVEASPRVRQTLETARTEGKNAQVLNPDNDHPMAWIRPWGQGRVFYCSFGHMPTVTMQAPIVQFYLAGIQYALGDLNADDTPVPTPAK
ncbi:MAG: hypothetical protein RLZZ399_1221 [Verrucomicrobiota bacterium]|jgi:type 1 glutamine amidotransferase